MSAAPSWPLVIVASVTRKASLRCATSGSPPGLNFDPFPSAGRAGFRASVLNSFFRPPKRKTTLGATWITPARQIHLVPDCKSPKLPNLPTAYGRKRPRPPDHKPCFSCCHPDMGWPSWKYEGQVPESPHFFVYDALQV